MADKLQSVEVSNSNANASPPFEIIQQLWQDQGDGSHAMVVVAKNSAITASTPTDRSGSITLGGTAQQIMAANTSRRYLLIQNNSSANLWINFGIAAVQSQPSIQLQPGQAFVMENNTIFTSLVSIIGATTGQTFTAKEA